MSQDDLYQEYGDLGAVSEDGLKEVDDFEGDLGPGYDFSDGAKLSDLKKMKASLAQPKANPESDRQERPNPLTKRVVTDTLQSLDDNPRSLIEKKHILKSLLSNQGEVIMSSFYEFFQENFDRVSFSSMRGVCYKLFFNSPGYTFDQAVSYLEGAIESGKEKLMDDYDETLQKLGNLSVHCQNITKEVETTYSAIVKAEKLWRDQINVISALTTDLEASTKMITHQNQILNMGNKRPLVMPEQPTRPSTKKKIGEVILVIKENKIEDVMPATSEPSQDVVDAVKAYKIFLNRIPDSISSFVDWDPVLVFKMFKEIKASDANRNAAQNLYMVKTALEERDSRMD